MLVPVTALWAAVLGLLSIALAARVSSARGTENVIFGDDGNVGLQQRIRVHANLVEYAPIALLLLLVLELNSTSTTVLHALGGSFLAARLLHAFGLSRATGRTPGRFFGTLLTWIVIGVECVLALYALVI